MSSPTIRLSLRIRSHPCHRCCSPSSRISANRTEPSRLRSPILPRSSISHSLVSFDSKPAIVGSLPLFSSRLDAPTTRRGLLFGSQFSGLLRRWDSARGGRRQQPAFLLPIYAPGGRRNATRSPSKGALGPPPSILFLLHFMVLVGHGSQSGGCLVQGCTPSATRFRHALDPLARRLLMRWLSLSQKPWVVGSPSTNSMYAPIRSK